MQPIDITIGAQDTLVIRWRDGSQSFVPSPALRRACPCTACTAQERMTSGPYVPLQSSLATRIASIDSMGTTRLQVRWEDGHDRSIYSFDQLRHSFPPSLLPPVDV